MNNNQSINLPPSNNLGTTPEIKDGDSPKQEKSKLWAWSLIVLPSIILLSLIISSTVSYYNGQKAAEQYQPKAVKYLSTLSNDISLSSSPVETSVHMRASQPPQLTKTMLGSFSKNYRHALISSEEIKNTLETISKENQKYLNIHSLLESIENEKISAAPKSTKLIESTNLVEKKSQLIELTQTCMRISDSFTKYDRVPSFIQKDISQLKEKTNELCAAISNYDDALERGDLDRINTVTPTLSNISSELSTKLEECNEILSRNTNNNKEFAEKLSNLADKISNF